MEASWQKHTSNVVYECESCRFEGLFWTWTHKYWAIGAYFIMKHVWFSLKSKIFFRACLSSFGFAASMAKQLYLFFWFFSKFFLKRMFILQKVSISKQDKLIDRRVTECLLIPMVPKSLSFFFVVFITITLQFFINSSFQ